VNVLVPNLSELVALTGGGVPDTLEDVADRARVLTHDRAVVVTLGERGALIVEAAGHTHVPAPAVDAVDTTAAGDAFCGTLASHLARGGALHGAVQKAVRVGALTTMRHGALDALPSGAEIEGDPDAGMTSGRRNAWH
jgi:sugar/nucleoside kinase (ribokinase family)